MGFTHRGRPQQRCWGNLLIAHHTEMEASRQLDIFFSVTTRSSRRDAGLEGPVALPSFDADDFPPCPSTSVLGTDWHHCDGGGRRSWHLGCHRYNNHGSLSLGGDLVRDLMEHALSTPVAAFKGDQ